MDTHLHIVTTENPSSVENAALADVYFLIKGMFDQKISIHLHCFTKRASIPSHQLASFCSSIDYYNRDYSNISFKLDFPYNISSRSSTSLIDRLNQDDYPILFIGLTNSFPIYNNSVKRSRKTAIRLNKNESNYFNQLSSLVPWKGKKLHYFVEAYRMRNYLKKMLSKKVTFFCDSKRVSAFSDKRMNQDSHYVPLFTGIPPIFHQPGKGHFCLFYGSLSTEETAYAAFWLLEHVFNKLAIPFVIAGSNPSSHLETAAHVRQHTCLVANPSDTEMQELIKKAQIVLSPAFIQEEGDGNLLQALSLGRHILINPKRSNDAQVKSVCHIAESPEEFIEKAKKLFEIEFNEEEKFSRQQILNSKFEDIESIQKIINWLS